MNSFGEAWGRRKWARALSSLPFSADGKVSCSLPPAAPCGCGWGAVVSLPSPVVVGVAGLLIDINQTQ